MTESTQNQKPTPDDSPDADAPAQSELETPKAEQPEAAPEQPEAGEDLSALSHEQLIDKLSASLDQIGEMKDGYLRAKAEVENIRRRSQNEIAAARKFAVEEFARALLTVKDSLDQAAAVEWQTDADQAARAMNEGLALTLKQLDQVMASFAVSEVPAAVGVKFDPEQHQAISTLESSEAPPDHIVSVMQKGFLLNDRLLRPAMVVVSRAVE